MIKYNQVSIRGSYTLTVKQFATFLLGLTCALPAVSLADELDDVLNDLLNYRLNKRTEEVQAPFTSNVSQELAAKTNAKTDSKSARAAMKTTKEDESAKSTATKK